MLVDVVAPVATAIGAGVAAGIAGFRLAKGRMTGPGAGSGGATYVRLSAEDSDRVEKISALLERLIALEGQTQGALERLAQTVTESRLEHARRHGEVVGRLGGLGR